MSEADFLTFLRSRTENYIQATKTRNGHVQASKAWTEAVSALSPWTILALIDAYEAQNLARNAANQLELLDG